MPLENVVGLFCPNCGSKNETADTPCGNCGFRLAEVAAPKFKGTMMLSSDKAVRKLIDAHEERTQARATMDTAPAESEPVKPFAATMVGAAGIPRPVRTGRKNEVAGTVLGVAPQGLPTDEPSHRTGWSGQASAPAEFAPLNEETISHSELNRPEARQSATAETEPPVRPGASTPEDLASLQPHPSDGLSPAPPPVTGHGSSSANGPETPNSDLAGTAELPERGLSAQAPRRWTMWHILLCVLTLGLYAFFRPKSKHRTEAP